MRAPFYSILFLFIAAGGCMQQEDEITSDGDPNAMKSDASAMEPYEEHAGKGALLLTRFTSLDDFKKVVQVQYADDLPGSSNTVPQVHLTYISSGREITSVLKSGISQADFTRLRYSSTWNKILLGLRCPFALFHRKALAAVEHLGRRRPDRFGKGDVAFYDLAEGMVRNIRVEDRIDMSCEDLSEKGYLNTFNHITAQALMTSIFSERLADFVADVHELYNMPELVTGNFTEVQLADFVNGPADNYVDMLNNEWGQELGKVLREKYKISRKTIWTPQLMADVLNDIQSYHSWVFEIGFKPFRPTDEVVAQIAWKINVVLENDKTNDKDYLFS